MRNVLVGEFIGPLLDYVQNQGRKSSTSNVDNLVEIKRKDIEINKLKESLTSAQNKIDKLEEELDELDRLEKDRQINCEIIIDKLIKGRTDELDSTKLILEQYDARCNENKDMINKVSGEIENLRESVTSALEAFKSDIGEAKVSSTQAPPSFADVVATGSSKENVTIFVDLPVEGEGVKDFRGFKNALGAILSKESCKCSGIYETKKGAKLTAPSLSDANSIKEIIGKTESLLTLKVNIMTKEPPKFIIKYTSLNDEKVLLEQLVLKNPFFSATSPKVLFKIDINEIDQYHWVIEIGIEGLDLERRTHKIGVPENAPDRIGLVARVACPSLDRCTPRLKLPFDARGTNGIVASTRRDSDLEAFSHNPTDGSFAPLASRPSA
ncbi:hypothetical protein JTE90_016105 [Oedothorax gibbosus]|uniref:Uncharacterized protein n=1 Tax=Oedothorax gibbosus TaxID=931172 RepID=A0AAV6TR99_9ARAC|nr:hypothetical protein JTE90_016105 [Oedothorax gibbosus]